MLLLSLKPIIGVSSVAGFLDFLDWRCRRRTKQMPRMINIRPKPTPKPIPIDCTFVRPGCFEFAMEVGVIVIVTAELWPDEAVNAAVLPAVAGTVEDACLYPVTGIVK
jgi:hypothetical protein